MGRPNVGKSTLLNQIVGQKVAISSTRPQTTRTAIRGILHRPDAQVVFVDTPGFHKPKTTLGKRLNSTVRRTLDEVDAALFVLDASKEIGKGDAFLASQLKTGSMPVICVVNKADKVMPDRLLEQIENGRKLGDWRDVLTTSASRGTGIDDLIGTLIRLLPEGPPYYPAEMITDQSELGMVSELIREKALQLTREEVPHSVAVEVEEIVRDQDRDLIEIYAHIFVERDSQKGILIGRGGKMLKEIGTRARIEIETLLGQKVFLDLRVKVLSEWQRDDRSLDRLGY